MSVKIAPAVSLSAAFAAALILAFVSCTGPAATFDGQHVGSPNAGFNPEPTVTGAALPPITKQSVANSGEKQKINVMYFVNPDCTSAGYASVKIIGPPKYGVLTTQTGKDYPQFPRENQRYICNLNKTDVVEVYYQSNPGYEGPDYATTEFDPPPGVGYSAVWRLVHYEIYVRSRTNAPISTAPPSGEAGAPGTYLRRAVPHDNETMVFSSSVASGSGGGNCTAAYVPTFELLTPPRHGSVRFTTAYLSAAPGSWCTNSVYGAAVMYRPSPGFVGADQFTVKVPEDTTREWRSGPQGPAYTIILTVN